MTHLYQVKETDPSSIEALRKQPNLVAFFMACGKSEMQELAEMHVETGAFGIDPLSGEPLHENPLPEAIDPDGNSIALESCESLTQTLRDINEGRSPAVDLVYGGEPLTGSDCGYGDATFFQPEPVAEFGIFLNRVTQSELEAHIRRRLNQSSLTADGIDATCEMILYDFRQISEVVQQAVNRKRGLIVQIA